MATFYRHKCRHCNNYTSIIEVYKRKCHTCLCCYIVDEVTFVTYTEQYWLYDDKIILFESYKFNISWVLEICKSRDKTLSRFKFEGFKNLEFHRKRLKNIVDSIILQ